MKIKILTRNHGTVETEGDPTEVPELFVTPVFYGDDGWSDEDFVLTHAPTGIKMGNGASKADCQRFATLLAETKIPWAELKTPDDAKRYHNQYQAARERYLAGV